MNKRKSDPLRKLARTIKYQSLYNATKEIPNIQLFQNVKDISKIQLNFLYWLAIYNRLYCDLVSCDNKYLTKKVIEDDFLCDCYLIWERKKRDKTDKVNNNKKGINRNSKVPSVVFTRGKK